MKLKLLLSLLLLYLSNSVFAQRIFYKDFKSVELGVTRTLKIFIPASYEKQENRLYPLAILFDGDYLFDVYTANARLFAQRDKAPEQIVVGIMQNRNKERYNDCGYDKVNGLPTEESDRFYRFVRMELINYFESNYRLSPFRTLVGATLTANFINYFAVENQVVFDAFININPYYNNDMAAFLQNKLSQIEEQKMYYYLSSGNYNSKPKHKRIQEVAHLLKTLDNPNIVYKFDNFKNSTKISSIGQSIPQALAHIFDIYSAISQEEFSLNIQHLSPPDAIAYLENKYVEIEYLFGTNMKIRERDIYAIEPIIIDREEGDYLVSFGEMIHKLYPETPISDYYIGMFYEKRGRYKQALKNYKNGYAKMDQNREDAEAYYQNIERVLNRQDEIIQEKENDKELRQAEKELIKIEREEEKAQIKLEKEEEKRQKEELGVAKRLQWEKEKEKRKLMSEAEKKKEDEIKQQKKLQWEKEKKSKKSEKEKREKAEEEMRKRFRNN